MLHYPLIHPPLLAALAASGHGGKVLIADGNFAHRTNTHPATPVVYLNLSPGLLTVDQVLTTVADACPIERAALMAPDDGSTAVADACPIERAALMAPDDGSTAAAEPGLRTLLGAAVPVTRLPRAEFYAACREPDLAVAVATGDQRHFANVLLTLGYLPEIASSQESD